METRTHTKQDQNHSLSLSLSGVRIAPPISPLTTHTHAPSTLCTTRYHRHHQPYLTCKGSGDKVCGDVAIASYLADVDGMGGRSVWARAQVLYICYNTVE